jgi:light-regulated signal transduction histidine kinase (bacteriophytochrome)
MKDAEGNIVKWYGTSTDVEDQKKAEALLEQRVKERTQELEQFTYVSHHDLQEPLRKIILFTDMVKSDGYERLPEASQKRLDRVTDAARRMSQALRDVLSFATLNMEEQFSKVDLEEVLAAVSSDLELVIQEKGARLFAEELPTIKAIPVQMHQLFYNLINNALKFSKPGQPPVINIRCKTMTSTELQEHPELNKKKRYHLISVEDNGIGFSEQHKEKIFTLFQRLHSKETYSGTGIGLSLVRKVVMNHAGKVWAYSTPEKGATFNVLLPVE